MIDTLQIFALKQFHPNGCTEAVNLLCQAIADACNTWLGDISDGDETAETIKSALCGVKMGGTKANPHLDVTLSSCIWRLTIANHKLVATFLRDI